jgi:uncharacterized protein YjbI with pentapeptide repeats
VSNIKDLRHVDLHDADLRGANLHGTELSWFEGVKLRNAKYDQKTRWPEGFDVSKSGAKLVGEDSDAASPDAKKTDKNNPKPDEKD